VNGAPLGLRFNGSLWFRWQLQNRGSLALTQRCQEHDPAVRKFQRIVMCRNPVFGDLPNDCRRVFDHPIVPRPQSGAAMIANTDRQHNPTRLLQDNTK